MVKNDWESWCKHIDGMIMDDFKTVDSGKDNLVGGDKYYLGYITDTGLIVVDTSKIRNHSGEVVQGISIRTGNK